MMAAGSSRSIRSATAGQSAPSAGTVSTPVICHPERSARSIASWFTICPSGSGSSTNASRRFGGRQPPSRSSFRNLMNPRP